ncbi:hypothetical protein LSTR_LSTR010215 [Laodelphax striatellus]|uniref:Uncharacterized protein n=1 Tax=Laodelphax striatellus TaxID=195883 RepID=A0A482WPQ9_LAOST|nr:hypothetical protein LSTR_LSTR010215 [Laodelphax striatellus]
MKILVDSVTTTDLGNDWKVIREEEVAETFIVGQAPFEVQSEQVAHCNDEFQVITQDDTTENKSNVIVDLAQFEVQPEQVTHRFAEFQVTTQDDNTENNSKIKSMHFLALEL